MGKENNLAFQLVNSNFYKAKWLICIQTYLPAEHTCTIVRELLTKDTSTTLIVLVSSFTLLKKLLKSVLMLFKSLAVMVISMTIQLVVISVMPSFMKSVLVHQKSDVLSLVVISTKCSKTIKNP